MQNKLLKSNILNIQEIDLIKYKINKKINNEFKRSEKEIKPTRSIFKKYKFRKMKDNKINRKITFAEAINESLHQSMKKI